MTSAVDIRERQRVLSRPLAPPNAEFRPGDVVRLSERIEQELRLLIPEPRRDDVELTLRLVPKGDQLVASVYMRPAQQCVLALDRDSALPVDIAISEEIAQLEARIGCEFAGIVARLSQEVGAPLSPRHAAAVSRFSGRQVSVDLATGPLELLFPDEPAAEPKGTVILSGQVIDHTPDCLQLCRISDEKNQAHDLWRTYARLTLRLGGASPDAQGRVHRLVGELFARGGGRRMQFKAVPYVSKALGRIAFLELVDVVNPNSRFEPSGLCTSD